MITEIINAEIAKKQAERATRVRSGKWSPSSFGYCFRRQWWNKKNEEQTNPPDERTLRVFSAGDIFHKWIQGYLPEHQSEVLIEDDNFKGYADIVFDDCVWDIKTQHSRAFWHQNKEGVDILKEKHHNWLQVGWYAMRLGKPFCGLAFVSKDDLCIDEYKIDINRLYIDIRAEEQTLLSLTDLPEPEPRAFGIVSEKDYKSPKFWRGKPKECASYCPFRDKCFKERGIEIPKEDK